MSFGQEIEVNSSMDDRTHNTNTNNNYVTYKIPINKSTDKYIIVSRDIICGNINGQPLYKWFIQSHNLIKNDVNTNSSDMNMTNTDSDYNIKYLRLGIYDIDREIQTFQDQIMYAINHNDDLVEYYTFIKYHGIKIKPFFFIAKNIEQIIDSLQHFKLCLIYIKNNEKFFIDHNNVGSLPLATVPVAEP